MSLLSNIKQKIYHLIWKKHDNSQIRGYDTSTLVNLKQGLTKLCYMSRGLFLESDIYEEI
jgi:hypothetical protein